MADDDALLRASEIHAVEVIRAWGGCPTEASLKEAHRLLSVEDVSQIVRTDLYEFMYRHRLIAPPRDEAGTFAFPAYPQDVRYVELARQLVSERLRTGALVATGTDMRDPFKPPRKIPSNGFATLEVHFDASELRFGPVVLRDIRVTLAPTKQSSRAPKKKPAGVEAWFKERVDSHPAGMPAPSEEDDLKAYRDHFGENAPRQPFRDARKNAPSHWLKKGPRGPRK